MNSASGRLTLGSGCAAELHTSYSMFISLAMNLACSGFAFRWSFMKALTLSENLLVTTADETLALTISSLTFRHRCTAPLPFGIQQMRPGLREFLNGLLKFLRDRPSVGHFSSSSPL